MTILVLAIYGYIYTRVNGKSDAKQIWVPPKPKASLPFGLGPPAEPIKAEDFEKTTYKDYEIKLLKETVQQLVMSSVMSYFMSMKFEIYISLLVQVITLPFNLYEFTLFKKYIMGQQKKSDGSNLYGEEFTAPTAARIAELERARLAAAGGEATPAVEEKKEGDEKLTPSVAKSAIAKDEPRVEVLEEESAPKKDGKKKKTAAAAVEKKSEEKDLNDIDE